MAREERGEEQRTKLWHDKSMKTASEINANVYFLNKLLLSIGIRKGRIVKKIYDMI